MTDVRTRLADALREAAVDRTSSVIDRQVEAVLSLPGIAIVELPEAMPKGQTRWPDDAAFPVGERSLVRVLRKSIRWGDSKYPVAYARALAAALLAAANAAEADQ